DHPGLVPHRFEDLVANGVGGRNPLVGLLQLTAMQCPNGVGGGTNDVSAPFQGHLPGIEAIVKLGSNVREVGKLGHRSDQLAMTRTWDSCRSTWRSGRVSTARR